MRNQSPLAKISRSLTFLVSAGIGCLTILIFALSYHLKTLKDQETQTVLSLAALRDVRFNAIQIQQFLTDASLTHDHESLQEALERKEASLKALDKFEKISIENSSEARKIRQDIQVLYDVGLKMYQAYVEQGLEAGNALMKEPGTGFDSRSENLEGSLNPLIASKDSSQQQMSMDIKFWIDLLPWISIAFAIAISLFLGFGVGRVIRSAFQALAQALSSCSSEIHQSTVELTDMSTTLSNVASECASSLQETTATTEEISASLSVTNRKIDQQAQDSKRATSLMAESHQSLSMLLDVINQMKMNSKQIKEITTLIEDMAFQTNLLALNAAVESARAGEQGKGFAVVADAVRTLAGKSATAAKDISELIQTVVQNVENGSTFGEKVGASIEELKGIVNCAHESSSEIKDSSQEQFRGIEEMSSAIQNIDSAAQSVAVSSEKLALSSQRMTAQSQNLQIIVGDLTAALGAKISSEMNFLESETKSTSFGGKRRQAA